VADPGRQRGIAAVLALLALALVVWAFAATGGDGGVPMSRRAVVLGSDGQLGVELVRELRARDYAAMGWTGTKWISRMRGGGARDAGSTPR